MSDELQTLIPPVIELSIGGKTLALAPFRLGVLPEMARTCAPFAAQLKPGESVDWLELIGEHGESVFEALALASGQQRVWVESLTVEEGVLLAEAVIGLNTDFFFRRFLPKIIEMLGKMTARIQSGLTPSSS